MVHGGGGAVRERLRERETMRVKKRKRNDERKITVRKEIEEKREVHGGPLHLGVGGHSLLFFKFI